MGCSFDRIGVTIDKKENIKTFVEIFNRELKDQLYWGEDNFLSEDDFENDDCEGYSASIEEEPLFRTMENGAQFEDVVYKYLETVPDCEFSAWYECTFNNCGAIVYTTYDYEDGVLKVVDKNSEESYLDYCPECDWEACCDEDFGEDELCTIDEWDENTEYKCPRCGAVLEWDVCVDEYTLKMIDGELVEGEE